MTDLVNLKFQVNTEDLKKGQTDLDGIAKSGQNASTQVNNFSNAATGATKSINQWGAAVPKATQSTQGLFGSVGNLINKLKPGQDEMAGFGRKAGQAGIQIQQFAGQVQMGTSASVALSQQAADLGFVLGFPLLGAVTGLAAGLGGPLIASLMNTASETSELETKIKNAKDELKEFGAAAASISMFNANDAIISISEASEAAKDRLSELRKQLTEASKLADTSDISKVKSLKKEISDLEVEIWDLDTAYNNANKELTLATKLAADMAKSSNKVTKETLSQAKSSQNLIDRLKQQNDTFGKSSAAIIRYNGELAAAEAPTKAQRDRILELSEALAQKTENAERATEAQKAMDKAAAESARIAEESAREYERTFNTLSDNITDAIMDFRSLGDVATAVAEQIKRAFVQNAIVNPLLGALGMSAPTGSLVSGGLSLSGLLGAGAVNRSFLTNTAINIGDFLAFGSTGTAATGSLSAGAGGSHALDFAGAGPSGLGSGSGLGLQGGLAGAATVAAFAIPAVMSIAQLFSGGTPRLTFGHGNEDFRQSTETAFGRFGVVGGGDFTKDVSDATIQGFLDVVEIVDESIASVLNPSIVSNVGETLKSMDHFLGTWDQYLGEGESITHQYTAGVLGRAGADPADQLIMRYEHILGEALPKVFSDQLLENTDDIEQFVGSTVTAMSTLHESQNIFVDDLQELAGAYEKWAMEGESFSAFFTRVNQAAIADLQEFALAMQNTFAGIESLAGLSLSIREQLLSDEQLYDRLREQADAIGESINTLSSPEAIQQAIAEYQSLSGRAFSLLSEEQQQLSGAEIADSIDSVVMAATERANALIDEQSDNRSIEEFATSTQEMANTAATFGTFVQQFGDNVNAMIAGIVALQSATASLANMRSGQEVTGFVNR